MKRVLQKLERYRKGWQNYKSARGPELFKTFEQFSPCSSVRKINKIDAGKNKEKLRTPLPKRLLSQKHEVSETVKAVKNGMIKLCQTPYGSQWSLPLDLQCCSWKWNFFKRRNKKNIRRVD